MNIEWLTIEEVAEIYKISPSMQSKLRMKSSNSGFPFYKMGSKLIRYDRSELDMWVKSNPANTKNTCNEKQKINKTVEALCRIYGDIE